MRGPAGREESVSVLRERSAAREERAPEAAPEGGSLEDLRGRHWRSLGRTVATLRQPTRRQGRSSYNDEDEGYAGDKVGDITRKGEAFGTDPTSATLLAGVGTTL